MSELLWPDEDPVQITKDMFDKFLLWCESIGANDIYIEAGEELAVKKDNIVQIVGTRKIRYDELIMILKDVFQPSIDSLLRGGKDVDFNYSVLSEEDDTKISYRVNVTPTRPGITENTGCEVVLRIISNMPPTTDDLAVEPELINLCRRTQGLVLMVGPTGSGKTTLIASFLRRIIETQRKHVLTFEDPIEFDLKAIPNKLSRIVQSEVYHHIADWPRAVRNSLRRSPDVMLYGELRDNETIKSGLLASETGHLVFATAHANSVDSTFSRMVESMMPDEARGVTAKLIESTQAIIFQKLVRRRGGGRTALRSYLILTDKMRRTLQTALIKSGEVGPTMTDLLHTYGKTLMSDAKEKFGRGLIDLEEYLVLINQNGEPDDAQIIPDVAQGLLNDGVIDGKEFDDWLSAYREMEAIPA